MVESICNLIKSDSYTIAEICHNVGITEAIYFRWKSEKVEFFEAIKNAENERLKFFATEAKKSLLKKIQGYTVQEKRTVTVDSGRSDPSGKSIPKIKEQTITDKHIQPDTAAIIFTLVNQDPDNWKNRQNSEITGKDGKDLIPYEGKTIEQIKAELKEIASKLNE